VGQTVDARVRQFVNSILSKPPAKPTDAMESGDEPVDPWAEPKS
jgi:hypothetical protein